MANYREHSDQHDDAEFERLLQSGYPAAEPSAEFRKALLQQLDQEFARTYQSVPLAAVPSISDAMHETRQAAADTTVAGTTVADHARSQPRGRMSLRVAMTMTVAASLLLVVSLWNSQTAYGWAAMLRALENCGWVQAASETAGLSGWVSSQRGVVAIQSAEQIAFHDHNERTSSRYSADHQVIYQQALPTNGPTQGPAELFGLLLRADQDRDQGLAPQQQQWNVVSESWRRVEARHGQAATIELLVTLGAAKATGNRVKLLVLLDPETHLPKSCRLLANDQGLARNGARDLEFTYPNEGPSSIFALGIPRETKIIASLANLDSGQSKAAREVEEKRLLGQRREPNTLEPKDQAPTLLAAKADDKNLGPKDINKKNANTKQPEAQDTEDKGNTENKGIKKNILNEATEKSTTPTVLAEKTIISPPATKDATTEVGEGTTERIASNPPRPLRELPRVVLPEQVLAAEKLIEQVNSQFAAYWQAQGVIPAEPASDTEFLRRVYLDLTGRIPMVSEVYEFLEDDSQDRREQLVDRLLDSRDHATHLATVWRTLLLPDGTDTNIYGGTGKFDQWLADRFEKNLPYDQLVRQLLLAEGRVSDSGPILFYAALKLNPEELAAKTARTFLGMRMECAQCHDHKFDESITQEDFWGFAAHFAQISRPRGKIEMTSSVLRVRDNNRGEVMLPDTEEVIPPRMPYAVRPTADAGESQQDNQDNFLSRRELLVDWLTTKQNSRFARATVNRAWQHLFGLGLVEPVDDMRADNPPTCPEVLETLSLDFAASGYDLRRLLRTLALSDAYQLSSRAKSDEPSQSLVFARMNIKSFTADQLYDCISVAAQLESTGAPNMAAGGLVRFGNRSRQAFIEQFRAPPGMRTDYHAGIPQALTLMHGYLVHGGTDLASSGRLKSLNAPFFSNEQRIETLFLSTLSRLPDKVEQEAMLAHVEAATNDQERSRALGDILWALLNSAEFTFIH